jgi:hypothetical protein
MIVESGMPRPEDAARRGKVGMGQDLLGGRVFDLSDPPDDRAGHQ